MRKTLAAAVLGGLLISGGSASASASDQPAHCKVVSSVTQTQTRDVTGQVAAPTKYGPTYTWNGHTYRHVTRYTWSGVQSRTVDVVTTKCRGSESTTVTPTSAWTGAHVVTTTTTQRVA